jgi:predicted nucleotidyltransferase
MNDLFSTFLELIKALNENNVEYILIGGMAINLHGFARNTEDIDLFIQPTHKNIELLKKVLLEKFNDAEINEITKEEFDKYAVIRFGTNSGFYIDIMTKLGEAFSFDDLSYEEMTIDSVKIKVADVRTLYRLKENTYREIDQLDLKFLKSKMENK